MIYHYTVANASQAMIVDGDGLNWLAKNPLPCPPRILSPHPGEAARLLATDTATIQRDRITAIKRLQEQYQGHIVLKGSGTLVLDDQLQLFVCCEGNPGMASGGMGDVLSGILGGLVAQGLTLSHAAQLSVWLHAVAADQAALKDGERGLLASDLFPQLHHLVNPLLDD
jgi:ADP-dependent NAD(P)H-hydrate dehydratase / NAD(P)H-hydrate epimerase